MVEISRGRAAVQMQAASGRFVFRGGRDAALACGRGFGLALPVQPLWSSDIGDRAALWLGPDEWLLIANEAGTLRVLRDVLAGIAHALVDVSSRDCLFDICGPDAALLLNTAIPLDLSEQGFPVGACTRTVFAKVGATLWRREREIFQLSVARSHGDYARRLLEEALRSTPEP